MDLIIEGNILTMSDDNPTAEAVGVANGVIVAVGSAEELKAKAGDETRYLDLRGKTVLPGFIDTHVHPGFTGASAMSVDLTDATSVDDVLNRLAARIADTPAGEMVYATRFNEAGVAEHRFPTLAELDKLSAEHSIAIHRIDGHSMMLNSRVLEELDLPEGTDGVVAGELGRPTGLVEDPAISQVFFAFAPKDASELMPLIQTTAKLAVEVGVTTIHMKEPPASMEILLANEDTLPVRVKPFFLFIPEEIEDLGKLVESGASRDRAIIGLIADGSPDSTTAAYVDPYPDDPTNRGVLFFTDDELLAEVEKAHRAGYQVSVHACGDRCVEQVLTTFEHVLEENPRADHRHRFEHFEMATEPQLRRAAQAGLAASMHPQHTNLSEEYGEFMSQLIGDDRWSRMVPLRSALDAGVLVAGGSDSPVAPMTPMTAIHDSVNHPSENQRISLTEALRMFTVDAARIGFEEDLKGTIADGKLADFAVLGEDPYVVPSDRLKDIPVVMTIVGGDVVYSAE